MNIIRFMRIASLMIALNLLFTMPLVQSQELGSEPANIRLSWSDDSAENTMTIMWDTGSSSNPNQVEYGLTISYELGTVSGISYQDAWSNNYHHEVQITGLEPDTSYHYRVSADSSPGGWSSAKSFRTGPANWKEFSFFEIGDSQETGTDLENIVSAMELRTEPEFVISAGDILDDWTYAQYEEWMETMGPIISEKPYFSSRGNHDDILGRFTTSFSWPGNEQWFSFNYSNVHFIILDTESTSSTQQLAWLKNDLISASNDDHHPWIFATFHKPGYCSGLGDHSPDYSVQTKFVPMFEEYGVDLVFSGHNHYYERMASLDSTINFLDPEIEMWGPTYNDPQHPVYFVAGWTSADNTRIPNNSSGYVQAWHDDQCFMEITVDEGNVHIQCIDESGTVLDEAWITKSGISEPTVSVPGVPQNIRVEEGKNASMLYWDAPADDGGLEVTGYNVYLLTDTALPTLITTTSDRSYTHTGLEPGENYSYAVSAINSEGESSLSGTVTLRISLTEENIPTDPVDPELNRETDYWWLGLLALIAIGILFMVLLPSKEPRIDHQKEIERLKKEMEMEEQKAVKPEPPKKPGKKPPIDLSDLPKAVWEE